jgi:hypothetical protein
MCFWLLCEVTSLGWFQQGNTMEVHVATTINGIESVAFITILPQVSIIYSDSQYYDNYMYVVAVFTINNQDKDT